MDVFQVHQQLIADYQAFTAGFTKIHDPRIREHVDRRVANGDQWPDAYLSLNPNFASGGSISELVKQGFLHPECEQIFQVGKEEPPASPGQVIDLHQHQREAIEIARGGASYVLTRPKERDRLIPAAQGLRFLVLDELHTYRGRQGADVAMLVRRLRDECAAEHMQCVGTSATMTSEGSAADRRREVATVATWLFGTPVAAPHVVGETLQRATRGDPENIPAITSRVRSGSAGRGYEELAADPLAAWIESQFGVCKQKEGGSRARPARAPSRTPPASSPGSPVRPQAHAPRRSRRRCVPARTPSTRGPGVRCSPSGLHQFLSKGDNVYLSLEPEADRYITSRYQTTAEILGWSLGLLRGERIDDMNEDLESLAGCRSDVHGPPPVLHGASTRSAEMEHLVQVIRSWSGEGVKPGQIGVGARSGVLVDEAVAMLAGAGIPAVSLAKRAARDGEVAIATMHRMKGLEFRCVAVVGRNPGRRRPALA